MLDGVKQNPQPVAGQLTLDKASLVGGVSSGLPHVCLLYSLLHNLFAALAICMCVVCLRRRCIICFTYHRAASRCCCLRETLFLGGARGGRVLVVAAAGLAVRAGQAGCCCVAEGGVGPATLGMHALHATGEC